MITPPSWTGESSWSGGALTLTAGQHATIPIGTATVRRHVEPVVWSAPGSSSSSLWTAERVRLGPLQEAAPEQGISPTPGVLLPRTLQRTVPVNRSSVRVDVQSGTLQLDALLVRPEESRLVLAGAGGRTELVHSSGQSTQPIRVGEDRRAATAAVYDASGTLVRTWNLRGSRTIPVPSGGFAIITH